MNSTPFSFYIKHCEHCLSISPCVKHGEIQVTGTGEVFATCRFCERKLDVFKTSTVDSTKVEGLKNERTV